MVKFTQSMSHWLWNNHSDIYGLVLLGHTELITKEMYDEYIKWCQTEDGKQYLEGGTKYKDDQYSKTLIGRDTLMEVKVGQTLDD